MQTITRGQLKEDIDNHENIALLEVLPAPEFDSGHIPGALSMPLERIEALAPEKLADKDQKIITYCANSTCPKAGKAAERLEALGYLNVFKYAEGKADWVRAGLPLEGGDKKPSEASTSDNKPSENVPVQGPTPTVHAEGRQEVDNATQGPAPQEIPIEQPDRISQPEQGSMPVQDFLKYF